MAEKFAADRCMVIDQNKMTVIKVTSSKFDSVSHSKIDRRYAQTLSGKDCVLQDTLFQTLGIAPSA